MSGFWADQRGATAVEYGLIVTLIALAVVGAITTLGASVKSSFDRAATAVQNAGP